MSDQPHALLEHAGDGVAVLRLNRPAKLNALSDDTVRAIFGLLDEVAGSDARALIVTGNGRGFCSGFDLTLAGAAEGDGAQTEGWVRRQEMFGSIVERLRAIPQPTIAAINGAACGAGLSLALACDTRIAARSAKFNCAFITIGMTSCDVGVSYLLPRAIGTTRAFELMLSGRMFFAEEAERIGLVAHLHDDDKLMDGALALARQIAANGELNTWLTKRGMWANLEAGSLAAAIELENRTQVLMQSTGSFRERATARGFLKG